MDAPASTFGAIGHNSQRIRFVIFSSYGNDSCGLIQWAHENELEGVCVVYSNTGWAQRQWRERVEQMEEWVQSLGFMTARTSSIGFADLVREKKAFPVQQFQWCSYALKIEPGMRWLEENDPEKTAVCLVGVRQEESQERADFPPWLAKSANHGGRFMLAPFAHLTAEERNEYLKRAGIEPLPHRSMECRCINSNKEDLKRFTEEDIAEIEALETEMGFTSKGKPRTMFRPKRCMGAVGIREVVKWAHSERGKYRPPEGSYVDDTPDDVLNQGDLFNCQPGWCGS